ncbi:MAG: 1-phosphofructokinase [Mycobacterium sp.]
MIVTVTPNPSVDRTVLLAELTLGAVNRGQRSWSEPSGKGVNVALALHAHGVAARAVVTAGGHVGVQLRQMLENTGLETAVVQIAGDIRSNISLTQSDGTVTKINEPGPTLTGDESQSLTDVVTELLSGASWLVCGGSLPAGLPDGWYAELVAQGHRDGVRVAVDSSGPPLLKSLAAQPDLIKPNLDELAELTGRLPRTLGEVVAAAHEVRALGARTVLASLGSDGAVLADADGTLWGRAPVAAVVSTVGAGDAMLAGYLSGGTDRRTAFGVALQWGAAAVQHEGTLFSAMATDTPVRITDDIDPQWRLGDGQ